jgi:hypothetical protein
MTFFRIAGGIAAALLSSAALAVTLSPVAAGTSYHSELTFHGIDSTGQLGLITQVVDTATGLDAAASLPLQIWPDSRREPFGYWEDRAWVGFMIPQEMGQGASSVGLSLSNNLFPLSSASIYVNQVSSTFPGAGESVTGSAAASIYTDVGDGQLGSGSMVPGVESMIWLGGSILSEIMAHAGGMLYLGLATHTIQIPLFVSDSRLHIATASTVPLPSAAWLLGSALAGIFGAARLRRRAGRPSPAC